MEASQLAVDSQSLKDFVQSGAAWGLQIRQYRDNPSGQWNNVTAYIPFEEKHQFYHDVMAHDYLKLVVDPLYNEKHPSSDEFINCPVEFSENEGNMLDARSYCYDLYTFDDFRLRLSAKEGPLPDTARLVVEKSCWRGGRYGPWGTWRTIKIRYDSGSRLWLQQDEESDNEPEPEPRATVRASVVSQRKPRDEQNRPSKKRKVKAASTSDRHSTKRQRGAAKLSRVSSPKSTDEGSASPQVHRQLGREALQSTSWTRVQFEPARRPPPKPSNTLVASALALPTTYPQQPEQRRGTLSTEYDGPEDSDRFSSSTTDQDLSD
ncbi:hypothetical protein B0H66DRAFT_624363 [Apodospora peruviana]|uniref:Uncharacterized protein n=1 Tax=Apodospora peruviana TaxID=516989 RepID=A0AAE0M1U7_9PEZI|nr:hypothetical protein B0H66DRAFT_624363 [Apodospora peruviana]